MAGAYHGMAGEGSGLPGDAGGGNAASRLGNGSGGDLEHGGYVRTKTFVRISRPK